MANNSSATITAKVGAGITATAVVINNVNKLEFDTVHEVLFVYTDNQPSPSTFELTGSNTITMTASGGLYTLTIT